MVEVIVAVTLAGGPAGAGIVAPPSGAAAVSVTKTSAGAVAASVGNWSSARWPVQAKEAVSSQNTNKSQRNTAASGFTLALLG
jgi:hypothetical protein